MSEPDNRADTRERTSRGQFAPGNTISRLGGRPAKAVELAHAEALRAGCPPAELEAVIKKMAELGKGGNVQAAALLVRAFGLGREDQGPAVESGESYAEIIAKPGNTDRIMQLMDEIFSADKPPSPPAA
jgi:hypothetical protein